jgi:hypothetical protein
MTVCIRKSLKISTFEDSTLDSSLKVLSGMHSSSSLLELEPQGRLQITNRSICSSSNASSTSSDSDSENGRAQTFRAGGEELQGY